jgi:hypothetical protein
LPVKVSPSGAVTRTSRILLLTVGPSGAGQTIWLRSFKGAPSTSHALSEMSGSETAPLIDIALFKLYSQGITANPFSAPEGPTFSGCMKSLSPISPEGADFSCSLDLRSRCVHHSRTALSLSEVEGRSPFEGQMRLIWHPCCKLKNAPRPYFLLRNLYFPSSSPLTLRLSKLWV